MGRGMTDTVIEPARAHLIPGLNQVKKKALDAGAAGVTISGAGPSIIALVDSKKADAEKIALAMEEAFKELGVKSHSLCAKPGLGAKIIRKE